MRTPPLLILGFAFAASLAIGSTSALTTASPSPTSAAPAAATCNQPEYRQFDYWLGRWLVRNPEGKEIGRSEISSAADGCALRENWKSLRGVTGLSLNYYDSQAARWRQHWVGSDGLILHLEGGINGGVMVLLGESKSAGATIHNRIDWTLLPDGRVKQEWSTSSDGGKNWVISFIGLYERLAS